MTVFVNAFKRSRIALALVVMPVWLASSARGAVDDDADLLSLSIEDLMQIEITSVSKKAQKISEAAAAVSVITSEDIRRSGMTSIPELLRMVPGLHVASIDSSTWAITGRGFNSQFANKLLVMIDGRSVYTPLFSGTYWDVQDLMLEDIERIEVVRGPGAPIPMVNEPRPKRISVPAMRIHGARPSFCTAPWRNASIAPLSRSRAITPPTRKIRKMMSWASARPSGRAVRNAQGCRTSFSSASSRW